MSGRSTEWSRSAGRDIVRLVDIETHVKAIQEHGVALADAAERAGLDAAVLTCPDWSVRDLVGHQGQVHRWAASYVASGSTEPSNELEDVPGDDALLDWYSEGHAGLVDAINRAPADLACWAFLPAPSPLAFWARRQAHETAIHRVDAEGAAAGEITPFATDFAQDGIGEIVRGFGARKRKEPDRAAVLGLDALDAASWLLTFGGERIQAVESADPSSADAVVRGSSSQLYRWLWNRPSDAVVDGDFSVAQLWADAVRVRWN